jgi:plasmid stabilization system protein ParE
MDNTAQAVAPLRREPELEIRLANNPSAAVETERELEHLLRRLATHPHAVNAVLQTALALRRTPDAITARDVETWTPAI